MRKQHVRPCSHRPKDQTLLRKLWFPWVVVEWLLEVPTVTFDQKYYYCCIQNVPVIVLVTSRFTQLPIVCTEDTNLPAKTWAAWKSATRNQEWKSCGLQLLLWKWTAPIYSLRSIIRVSLLLSNVKVIHIAHTKVLHITPKLHRYPARWCQDRINMFALPFSRAYQKHLSLIVFK